jgi:hypothetical protein
MNSRKFVGRSLTAASLSSRYIGWRLGGCQAFVGTFLRVRKSSEKSTVSCRAPTGSGPQTQTQMEDRPFAVTHPQQLCNDCPTGQKGRIIAIFERET